MRNFVSPHVHPQSFDSGSTIKEMVRREKELGTGHATITDHGTLGGCLDHYDVCKKEHINPILGIEAFFRDDNCPILNEFGLIQPFVNSKNEIEQLTSAAGYQKYFHLTMHALDQEAYETIVRLHSKASLTHREHHGSEWKPLFTWKDLEELGSKNIIFCSSCLVGMVGRHLLAGKPELAERYYLKLKDTVKPGNFYVELFPHDCSHDWENKVTITLEDQSEIKLKEDRKILVNGERIKIKDFLRRKIVPGKFTLDGTFYYSDLTEVGKKIVSMELKKGFFKNECTVYSPDGDLQKSMNKFMIAMAAKHGDPIMISDDSHYAYPEEKLVQDARLGNGKEDWKFWGNYHRMSSDEAATHFYKTLGVTDVEIERWIDNGYEWASRFDSFSLKFDIQLPTRFYEQHGDLLTHVRKLIAKHGRLDIHNPDMISRLVTELNMLTQNGTVNLLPYFLPLEEVVDAYQDNGLLTGPGRGSAAGLLLTYLLGITHVNPLRYGLSLERFITEDRIKAGTLPDIDQDLEDRTFLVGENGHSGWLHNRFGNDYVAQISTNTNLRLKSSIKDVHRARGTLTDTVEQICKRLPTPPQGIDDLDFIFGKVDDDGVISKDIPGILDNPALQEYMDKYPEEWKIVQNMIGIPRQRSRHACAFIVGNKPIAEFIPMTLIGEVPCTEYTAKSVEKAGGIKTDFLVVNSLKDIRGCLELIRQREVPDIPEYVTLNSQRVPRVRLFPAPAVPGAAGTSLLDVWDLPEDQNVFASICQGETETVFQLNTSGAVQYLKLFTKDEQHLIRSIEDIAAFTALDRPGPLDYEVEPGKNMLHEFVTRKKGFTNRNAHAFSQYLLETLPETHGIMVYQEQVMKVVRELGGFNPIEANDFRICVGKKKQAELMAMRPKFLEGATPKVGADEAEKLFDMMVTFGQYGFNKSHAVCYSVIAYACAYLKYHYPLEWWCSVLQNADKKEIHGNFWRHCRHLILQPDINKSKDTFVVEDNKIRSPIGLMDGVGPAIRDELVRTAPFKDIRDLLQRVNKRVINRKILLKLLISGVMDSLFQGAALLEEQYDQYQQARHDVLGEDKEPLPEQYRGLLPIQLYCIRKDIIPTYVLGKQGNFVQTFLGFAPRTALESQYGATIAKDEKGVRYMQFRHGRHDYRMVNPSEFERLVTDQSKIASCAFPAYVIEEKRFPYAQGAKEALKLTIDFDGVVVQMVKWPEKDTGRVLLETNQKLEGSVVFLFVNRWKEGRDFSIDDIQWVCGVPKIEETPEET